MTWPAIPGPGAEQKLALLFQFEQNQWRRADEIAASQLEQAKRVLSFAVRTVPHYRSVLGAGFDARAIDADSWANVPILTRKTVHETGVALRSERIPAEHGRSHEIATSGSTGMVVKMLGTDLTQLFWQVFTLRDHFWRRRNFSLKLFAARMQRHRREVSDQSERGTGWGPATDDVVTTGPSVLFDIRLEVPRLVECLLAEQPGYLLTHPSLMLGLARHCLEHGIRIPSLREARTLGESSAELLRDTCRAAWDVPVVDMYTCQEAGYLALQCPDHEHLHVQSENVLLEVVDAAGRPCRPGEVGRVLITSLNNFATPLIRYELGDYAEVGEACPCGRGLPVLKRVMGRYRNLMTLPDGTHRWPQVGLGLSDIAPIEQMQMAQTGLEEIEVRLVIARPLRPDEIEGLTAYLHKNLGYPFRLSFNYVDSIRNPANGKVEQFISML